jgi:hypothetical protein
MPGDQTPTPITDGQKPEVIAKLTSQLTEKQVQAARAEADAPTKRAVQQFTQSDTRFLVAQAWALQDQDEQLPQNKRGRCDFIVDGIKQCCNLTEKHCNLIDGSVYTAGVSCPPK